MNIICYNSAIKHCNPVQLQELISWLQKDSIKFDTTIANAMGVCLENQTNGEVGLNIVKMIRQGRVRDHLKKAMLMDIVQRCNASWLSYSVRYA